MILSFGAPFAQLPYHRGLVDHFVVLVFFFFSKLESGKVTHSVGRKRERHPPEHPPTKRYSNENASFKHFPAIHLQLTILVNCVRQVKSDWLELYNIMIERRAGTHLTLSRRTDS